MPLDVDLFRTLKGRCESEWRSAPIKTTGALVALLVALIGLAGLIWSIRSPVIAYGAPFAYPAIVLLIWRRACRVSEHLGLSALRGARVCSIILLIACAASLVLASAVSFVLELEQLRPGPPLPVAQALAIASARPFGYWAILATVFLFSFDWLYSMELYERDRIVDAALQRLLNKHETANAEKRPKTGQNP